MLGLGSSEHPKMKDVPIGLDAHGSRREFDFMGSVEVPADYGAQTARSLVHFSIGGDRMPKPVYHAYGVVKKACALVNQTEGRLPDWKAETIIKAADETIAGQLDEHYPLFVWQTGSGTQSNVITVTPGQHRPDDPGEFVGQGNDDGVLVRPSEQRSQPASQPRIGRGEPRHHRPRTVDQVLAQVAAAAFDNAQQLRLAARGCLLRDQTKPRGQVTRKRANALASPIAATSAVRGAASGMTGRSPATPLRPRRTRSREHVP